MTSATAPRKWPFRGYRWPWGGDALFWVGLGLGAALAAAAELFGWGSEITLSLVVVQWQLPLWIRSPLVLLLALVAVDLAVTSVRAFLLGYRGES